ncbi:MAG: MlaE family ABC transporter permease [Gemmatimonadota bacterium]
MITGITIRVGHFARESARHAGRAGMLLWATICSLRHPRLYVAETFTQAKRIGVEGLGLVLLMGALSGGVLSQQTANQLSPGLPLEIIAGSLVGGLLTELGPILTAIVLAGRMGAGIGAELGTMQVTNQIDALLTLGRDPVLELVVPRVVAGTLILVPLVILANIMGILAGYFVCIALIGMTPQEFAAGAKGYYHNAALFYTLLKAVVFGFTITFIACYVGLRAGGGAAGVGRTATKAVVAIIVAIMVLDVILAPAYKAFS